MTIQESSDELNSPVSGGTTVSGGPPRSAKDYLALAIATCGVGYFPLAPGTLGSIVGVVLYLLLRGLFLKLLFSLGAQRHGLSLDIGYGLVALEWVAIVVVTLVGIWAASRTEKLSGRKDPGKVVIDEVAGQMIALTAVPLAFESWWTIGLAFVLFRFFDIVKPYPARRLESLESGLGIMADDVVAGAYAALVVAVVVVIQWFI